MYTEGIRVKRFVGPKELADYLSISINTVYSWIWQKRIPYVKLGKLVRFDLQEIDTWLKEKKIEIKE